MNAIVSIGIFVWIIGQLARALKWIVTRPLIRYAALAVTLFTLLALTRSDNETITGVTGILALALMARLYRRRDKDTTP